MAMLRLSSPDHSLLELARALQKLGYRFVTVTPESHRLVNARPSNAWARDLAGVFGWSRRFDPSILPAGLFALMQAADALVSDAEGWRSRYRFSTLDELLFLHSAYPTQAADAVFFGPDTYRFVGAIAQALHVRPRPWRRAADIGCGAGPGGIFLARSNASGDVTMTDINAEALRLSAVNAALAQTPNARPCRADLLAGVEGAFDLIVANPPYMLDTAERLYRHGGGARGEGVSLAIVDTAIERLAPGGMLLLYTGSAIVDGVDAFRDAVADRLAGSGHEWSYRELDPDVFGEELARSDADRIAAIFLTLTKVTG